MTRFFRRTRIVWLMSGLFVAALAGGLMSGVVAHWFSPASEANPLAAGFFRAVNAHASATDSIESLIIATGEIDNTIEGVYTLDATTGELRGAVLNPAKPNSFSATYKMDISQDFGAVLKNPKFLMVTGIIDMRNGVRGNARFGRSVIYVAEANSGLVNIYGVPWDQSKAAVPGGISGVPFFKLGQFKARDVGGH